MIKYNPALPIFSLHIPKTAGTSFENVLRYWFNDGYFPKLNNHPRLYRLLTPLKMDLYLQQIFGCGLYLHYRAEQWDTTPRKVPLGRKYGLFKRTYKSECVHGHFDPETDGGDLFQYYPNASQFITFLRDPLEMQLSLFFYLRMMVETGNMYWRGKKIKDMEYNGDIDQWVEERSCYLLKFLPMEFDKNNFKKIINDRFVHIGITEKMQTSIDILAEKLSFRSIVMPYENSTPRDAYPSSSAIAKFKRKHELEYLLYNYALSLNS